MNWLCKTIFNLWPELNKSVSKTTNTFSYNMAKHLSDDHEKSDRKAITSSYKGVLITNLSKTWTLIVIISQKFQKYPTFLPKHDHTLNC